MDSPHDFTPQSTSFMLPDGEWVEIRADMGAAERQALLDRIRLDHPEVADSPDVVALVLEGRPPDLPTPSAEITITGHRSFGDLSDLTPDESAALARGETVTRGLDLPLGSTLGGAEPLVRDLTEHALDDLTPEQERALAHGETVTRTVDLPPEQMLAINRALTHAGDKLDASNPPSDSPDTTAGMTSPIHEERGLLRRLFRRRNC